MHPNYPRLSSIHRPTIIAIIIDRTIDSDRTRGYLINRTAAPNEIIIVAVKRHLGFKRLTRFSMHKILGEVE